MKNNLGFLFLPSQLFLQHSLLNKVHLPNKMHQEPACYKHDDRSQAADQLPGCARQGGCTNACKPCFIFQARALTATVFC